MPQSIDPVKLKAAAEHLEWVLKQYPGSEDVEGLLHALLPLIEAAKASQVSQPMDGMDITGAFNFSDGRYTPFADPSVDEAYARFSMELRGGLTEQENS